MLTQQLNDNTKKQTNLLKVVEQLTEKVTKLETQPLHPQGFMTSSSQNVSSIYHRHIEHFFTFLAGNTVFSLISDSPPLTLVLVLG